jgi:two-component system chemotaxis response regulator CheB
MRVVGVCSSGPAVLAKLASAGADAIVLDLDMQCSAPQPLLKEIRDKFPELYVLSIVPSDSFLSRIPSALTTPGRSETIVRPRQATTAEAFLDDLASLVHKRLLEMLHNLDKHKANGAGHTIASESKSGIFALAPEARSSVRSLPSSVSGARSFEFESPSTCEVRAVNSGQCDKPSRRSAGRIEVVAIASSTGGPQALTEVLSGLPANFPVPIVVVQHMPADFTKNLADRLDCTCSVKVKEAQAGDLLKPGLAFIAPGDFHMALQKFENRRVGVTLNQGPMENSCRPAADVLFRSVVDVFGSAVLGVVLTGMGKDGLAGSETIDAAGGRVIVQDEASSVVWGMPGEIARAGLADAVLPLRELPGEILRRVGVGRI